MKRGNWFYISIIIAAMLYILLLTVADQARHNDQLKDREITVVLKSIAQPMDFWDVVQAGMEEAARESGIQLTFAGPPHEHMVDVQIDLFYHAVIQGPDMIVLAAGDYDLLRPPVGYAHAHGIPVITMDSSVNSRLPVGFVATDNVEAGRKAAAAMIDVLNRRGIGRNADIMIMSHSEVTSTAIDREDGVRQGLEDYPIAGTWYCDIDHQIAYDLTREALKTQQIDAIIGLNEVSTLGVADAVRDMGLAGEIPIVGFDNAAREMAYLEAGVLDAVVVQRPFNMGYISVKQAEAHLRGREVEPFINTGSIVITRDNMFQPEYQEVLFPFEKLEYTPRSP